MIILPAIDILGGQCVRLVRGEYDTASKVAADAVETAESFDRAGAGYIHLVDLDGAKEGKRVNAPLFCEISKNVSCPLELGGGIRDLAAIEYYLSNGITRCILGSAALKDPQLVRDSVRIYGSEHIAVGIDAKDGKVSVSGWLETSDTDYITFARLMEDCGVKTLIFTDISRDGTLSGCNLEQLNAINEAVSCDITASGGVRDINDIIALKKMNLYGAIAGKAIYSGLLDLNEAVRVCGEDVNV